MNFNDLFIKPQIYQECCITHHPHFGPNIKNTITIFHHLWPAFESADKPWLHYYFHSDKQSNIFYSSEFHFDMSQHTALHFWRLWKQPQNCKRGFSVIQSHISVPAFNPPLSQNTLNVPKLWCDPLLNVQVKSLLFFPQWQSLFAVNSLQHDWKTKKPTNLCHVK